MPRALKNILVRGLTEEDNRVIREIMRETGCFQASKAIMRMAHSYLRMATMTKRQSERVQELEAENHRLRTNAALIVESVKKLDIVLSKR